MKCFVFALVYFTFLFTSTSAQQVSSGEWSFGSFPHNFEAISDHLFPPHSLGYRNVSSSQRYEWDGQEFIEESTENIVYFQNGISYAVANNFMLGIQVSAISSSSQFNSFDITIIQSDLRYYVNSPFFVSLNPGIIFSDQLSTPWANYTRDYLLSFKTGFTLFSSNDLAFEPSFSFNRTFIEGGTNNYNPSLIMRYFPGRRKSKDDYQTSSLKKGNKMIGGSAYFNISEGERTLSLSPRLGYFLEDWLVFGGGFNYYRVGPILNSNADDILSQFELNVFSRGYPLKKLFLQVESDILLYHLDSSSEDVKIKNQLVISGEIGYSIFISRSIAFEPAVVYNVFNRKQVADNDANSFLSQNRLSSFGLEFTVQAFLTR